MAKAVVFVASDDSSFVTVVEFGAGSGRASSNVGEKDVRTRLGYRITVFAQAFEMKRDCFTDVALDFCARVAGRDASGQIRDISALIAFGDEFDNYGVFH